MPAQLSMRAPRLPARARGFSLLEILIAVVVLSIGLLGLAGLQFTALRGNSQSYERSQAQALAYEIADVMRTHRVAAGQGAFEIVAGEIPAEPEASCTDADEPCTRDEAAAFILDEWHRRLRTVLPAATARIECSVDPCRIGALQTVQVIWDESLTGSTDDSCPAAEDFDSESTALSCVEVSIAP